MLLCLLEMRCFYVHLGVVASTLKNDSLCPLLLLPRVDVIAVADGGGGGGGGGIGIR